MQEAQAVISKRTFDARAVFEQNTSAGQMHHARRSSLNQQSVSNYQSPPPSATAARKASLPVWPPASSIETSQQVISNWEERHTGEFCAEPRRLEHKSAVIKSSLLLSRVCGDYYKTGIGLTTGFIGSHTVTHNYSVYTL
jgi:hypothetical protein